MALSRGVPLRPQLFVAQADASPFAALLDAAVSPVPDRGAGTTAASAQPNQRNPAADTGAAAQNAEAVSAPAPSPGDAAHESAALDNGAPAQSSTIDAGQGATAESANDGKPVPAPDVNVNDANLAAAALANGKPMQILNADGTHPTAAQNGGDRKPPAAAAPNANEPALAIPLPQPSGTGNPNAPVGTRANSTRNGSMPSVNDPATPDVAADANKNVSDVPAAAAATAGVVDLSGAAAANVVTPVATKPPEDGKNGQKDQKDGSADGASALPAANPAQLPSPDAVQPVASAVVVNAAPDPSPAATAKPGLAVTDAIKARVRVLPTPAAKEQITPTQDETADAPGSSAAVDAGGNGAPDSSGSDDSVGATSAANTQQGVDQPPGPSLNGAALFNPIDFASLGGTDRFGWRGETPVSLNGAAAPAAPNGAANAAATPNFGIFGPSAMATNSAAPAAAAAAPAVPLAGLAVAIAARAQAGSSQFDIRLDPPELGRIDVRLDVDGSGQVRTHVTVDRPDTLQLLQSQQPQLERALEQAGLKTADNGLQFTLRDQSFAGQNGGPGGQHYANQPAAPLVIPEIDAAPIDTAQIYARLRLGNGLDISV